MAPCLGSGAGAKETFEWSSNLKNILKTCKKIRISRHGESQYNISGKIGGDSELSSNGRRYASSLGTYINSMKLKDLKIWTSELIRTKETVKDVLGEHRTFKDLNEIDSGDHDSMTYESIAENFPEEFALRDQDKLQYRYPNGESYIDVCRRIEKILCKIDPLENLLIVSHQAVIRCILAAIQETEFKDLPFIKVPLHTVLEIEFDSQGRHKVNYNPLNIETTDTLRTQGR